MYLAVHFARHRAGVPEVQVTVRSHHDGVMTVRHLRRARAHGTCVAPEPVTIAANLTIVVDDRPLKQARIRALEDGTSVNAPLRGYLERYSGVGDTAKALDGFARLARRSAATSGPHGRAWTRDELHDRTDLR
jgi:hypothetical protein